MMGIVHPKLKKPFGLKVFKNLRILFFNQPYSLSNEFLVSIKDGFTSKNLQGKSEQEANYSITCLSFYHDLFIHDG